MVVVDKWRLRWIRALMFNYTPKGDWEYARNKIVQIVTPMVE